MPRARLSVVMFLKNEAHRIVAALETVRWADEIVIIDDASTDNTAAVCRALGARVIACEDSRGLFYKRRNFGFSQASGEWVLMMDPDERVTPPLRRAIEGVLEDARGCAGFTFWRLNHFWNRPLRHGGWRQKSLHLFRRDAGRDREQRLHSPIEIEGRVGHLEAVIEHYPFGSLAEFVDKQNFYTSLEAKELAEGSAWTERELARRIALRPLKTFWKTYVKKRGFADGLPGFVLAVLAGWVELMRWGKCWEQVRSGCSGPGRGGTADAAGTGHPDDRATATAVR